MEKIQAIVVGVAPDVLKWMNIQQDLYEISEIAAQSEVIMSTDASTTSAVFCGSSGDASSLAEMAQLLRMTFAECPIYFVVPSDSKLDRRILVKNGFTDVFFLPTDQPVLKRALADLAAKLGRGPATYRQVRLIDFTTKSSFEFDTYIHLPLNGKYLKYSHAGDEIGESRSRRLRQHEV